MDEHESMHGQQQTVRGPLSQGRDDREVRLSYARRQVIVRNRLAGPGDSMNRLATVDACQPQRQDVRCFPFGFVMAGPTQHDQVIQGVSVGNLLETANRDFVVNVKRLAQLGAGCLTRFTLSIGATQRLPLRRFPPMSVARVLATLPHWMILSNSFPGHTLRDVIAPFLRKFLAFPLAPSPLSRRVQSAFVGGSARRFPAEMPLLPCQSLRIARVSVDPKFAYPSINGVVRDIEMGGNFFGTHPIIGQTNKHQFKFFTCPTSHKRNRLSRQSHHKNPLQTNTPNYTTFGYHIREGIPHA